MDGPKWYVLGRTKEVPKRTDVNGTSGGRTVNVPGRTDEDGTSGGRPGDVLCE